MVPEQMESRPHGGQHFVDGGLTGIFHTRQWEGTRRFVREENIDTLQCLTRVDLFMYKMTSPVVTRREAAKLARRFLIPRRRERAPQSRERERSDLYGNPVRHVVQVRERTAAGRLRGDEVEVFVVALDPVQ